MTVVTVQLSGIYDSSYCTVVRDLLLYGCHDSSYSTVVMTVVTVRLS